MAKRGLELGRRNSHGLGRHQQPVYARACGCRQKGSHKNGDKCRYRYGNGAL